MRKAVAVRHVSFEDLGLLEPLLREHGFDITYIDAWDIESRDIGNPDLLVFLGGPISVNATEDYPFIDKEIALARARIGNDAPTLGICLGAQIMNRAIGGTVRPGTDKEIGWAPITLTAAGHTSVLAPLHDVPVLHWHGDVCEPPSGIDSLATTPACATQAFAPSPNTLALQFHIEAGSDGIEPWLIGHTAEIASVPGLAIQHLREQTARYGSLLHSRAAKVFQHWMSAIKDR